MEYAKQRCNRSAEIATYLPLVKKIAGRLRARLTANVHRNELIQAGMIGLNDALTRFEERTGSTFECYAARRIEGAMLDSLRSDDALSRQARSSVREIGAAVKRLEHRLGRAPRAKEVANELGWPWIDFMPAWSKPVLVANGRRMTSSRTPKIHRTMGACEKTKI